MRSSRYRSPLVSCIEHSSSGVLDNGCEGSAGLRNFRANGLAPAESVPYSARMAPPARFSNSLASFTISGGVANAFAITCSIRVARHFLHVDALTFRVIQELRIVDGFMKRRTQDRQSLRRHARRRQQRTVHQGRRQNELEHLLRALVLREFGQRRHVGELWIAFERDVDRHAHFLLREPIRPRRVDRRHRHAATAIAPRRAPSRDRPRCRPCSRRSPWSACRTICSA